MYNYYIDYNHKLFSQLYIYILDVLAYFVISSIGKSSGHIIVVSCGLTSNEPTKMEIKSSIISWPAILGMGYHGDCIEMTMVMLHTPIQATSANRNMLLFLVFAVVWLAEFWRPTVMKHLSRDVSGYQLSHLPGGCCIPKYLHDVFALGVK